MACSSSATEVSVSYPNFLLTVTDTLASNALMLRTMPASWNCTTPGEFCSTTFKPSQLTSIRSGFR